ncbi:hypothetical protein OUZ56_001743 [Daphnia magna]|uniref:Uncharacterized protein n=1 Tax=Daphnia magna TaxID=35525 RepID=A0ABR0A445_9CRUS|nr:hypothetical protein OUZ56_001743 [Daphnia magna]
MLLPDYVNSATVPMGYNGLCRTLDDSFKRNTLDRIWKFYIRKVQRDRNGSTIQQQYLYAMTNSSTISETWSLYLWSR